MSGLDEFNDACSRGRWDFDDVKGEPSEGMSFFRLLTDIHREEAIEECKQKAQDGDVDTAETTDGGIACSTAWTYYNTVSVSLGWASKWSYLQKNYTRAGLVQESMTKRSASQHSQQQFWTPDQRPQILNYVNERAHDVIDEKGLDADVEARDGRLAGAAQSLCFTAPD